MAKEIFSFYREGVTETIPVDRGSLAEVLRRITGETLKSQTAHLRELLSQSKTEEYKEQKRVSLPSVTFGGVFDYRSRDGAKLAELGKKGLLSASGLVIIDIDHISETGRSLEELKGLLLSDLESGIRLVFTSPSGDGLKAVYKTSAEITDPHSYRAVFDSLRNYINNKYGEIVDRSGSDITRLCLLCHDPDARIVDSEREFNPDLHPVPKRERQIPLRELLHLPDDGEDGIEEIVRRVEESGKDIAPEYGEYLKLVYSFTALGERGRSYLHRVCSLSPKYRPEDTDKDFNNCLRSGETQSIGTFVNMARDNGIDVTRPVERPVESSTRAEETTDKTDKVGERWESYLEIPDLAQIASQKTEGIKTPYRFKELGQTTARGEDLLLRSGTMTLICGKSSHCKSKFLQNLALNLAEDLYNRQEDGSILFFTYEESLSDVLCQFANIYADVPTLSKYGTQNTEVIRDYLRSGDLSRCTSDKKEKFIQGVSSFRSLYLSGKLRVYYSDLSSQDLCSLIEYLSQRIKVRAVFVDYVQLLYREKNRKERREELKDICNDLRSTAMSLDVPLVLSAQLNRETPNPTDMSADNIASSADLTRYADAILCLWNSSFDNIKDKDNYLKSEDYRKLQREEFTLGVGGKVFAKITKNRGGSPNLGAVLTFRGETGKIYGNGAEGEDLPEEETNLGMFHYAEL